MRTLGRMTVGDIQRRLQERLDELGITPRRASIEAGLHQDAVRRILKRGHNPTAIDLAQIAKALDVDLNYFFPKHDLQVKPQGHLIPDQSPLYSGRLDAGVLQIDEQDYATIPRFDARLSAGPGSLLADEPEPLGYHLVEMQWLRLVTNTAPKHLATVQVDGDSMEPTLFDGDWVLVDTTQRRISRQGIFALRVFDSVWVKRLQPILSLGVIRIHSDNEAYDSEDVTEDLIQAIGRVVSIVARRLA